MQFIKNIVNKDFLVTCMLIILKSVQIHTNKFLNCDMFLAAILAGVSVGSISPFNGVLKLGCPRRGSQEPSLIAWTNSSSSDFGTELL